MSELEVTVKRVIPAAREVVFDAWLDAGALAKFMTPGPGMTVPKAKSDGRVGGKFLVVMKAGDQEMPHSGEYRVVDRPAKLQFTWESPFTTTPHVVTLTFTELGANETELTLHHVGFDTQESRDNHEGGWTLILEALARTVA